MAEGKYRERWIWSGDRSEFEDKLHEMIEWAGDLASFDIRLNGDAASIVALYDNRAWNQMTDQAAERSCDGGFALAEIEECDSSADPCDGRCRCDGGF